MDTGRRKRVKNLAQGMRVTAAAKAMAESGGMGKVCDGRLFDYWAFWQSIAQVDAMVKSNPEAKKCLARTQAALDAHAATCPTCRDHIAQRVESGAGRRPLRSLKPSTLAMMRQSLAEAEAARAERAVPAAAPKAVSGLRRLRRGPNASRDVDADTEAM
jgi:hypothetical protein